MNFPPRRFRLAVGVLAQTALREAVVLDARAGSYFSANRSASVILNALIEDNDEAQILSLLLHQFDADEDQLKADLAHCLDDWLTRGLIVEAA